MRRAGCRYSTCWPGQGGSLWPLQGEWTPIAVQSGTLASEVVHVLLFLGEVFAAMPVWL